MLEVIWVLMGLLIIWGVWALQKSDPSFRRWLWGQSPRTRKPKRTTVNQTTVRTIAHSNEIPSLLDRLGDWSAERPWYVEIFMWQFVLVPLAIIRLALAFIGIGILLYFANGGGAP